MTRRAACTPVGFPQFFVSATCYYGSPSSPNFIRQHEPQTKITRNCIPQISDPSPNDIQLCPMLRTQMTDVSHLGHSSQKIQHFQRNTGRPMARISKSQESLQLTTNIYQIQITDACIPVKPSCDLCKTLSGGELSLTRKCSQGAFARGFQSKNAVLTQQRVRTSSPRTTCTFEKP